jgi:hypothetical protein
MQSKKRLLHLLGTMILAYALAACSNNIDTAVETEEGEDSGKADSLGSSVSITTDKSGYEINSEVKATLTNNLKKRIYVDRCSIMELMVLKDGQWKSLSEKVCTAKTLKATGTAVQSFNVTEAGTYKVAARVGFGCHVGDPIGIDFCKAAEIFESATFKVEEQERSVTTDTSLVSLLNQLATLATEGPSLEHFSYKESVRPESLTNCSSLSSDEVVKKFVEMANDILSLGSETVDNYPGAVDAFTSVLKGETYLKCDESETGNRTITHFTYFVSKDSAYSIMFELSSED